MHSKVQVLQNINKNCLKNGEVFQQATKKSICWIVTKVPGDGKKLQQRLHLRVSIIYSVRSVLIPFSPCTKKINWTPGTNHECILFENFLNSGFIILTVYTIIHCWSKRRTNVLGYAASMWEIKRVYQSYLTKSGGRRSLWKYYSNIKRKFVWRFGLFPCDQREDSRAGTRGHGRVIWEVSWLFPSFRRIFLDHGVKNCTLESSVYRSLQ